MANKKFVKLGISLTSVALLGATQVLPATIVPILGSEVVKAEDEIGTVRVDVGSFYREDITNGVNTSQLKPREIVYLQKGESLTVSAPTIDGYNYYSFEIINASDRSLVGGQSSEVVLSHQILTYAVNSVDHYYLDLLYTRSAKTPSQDPSSGGNANTGGGTNADGSVGNPTDTPSNPDNGVNTPSDGNGDQGGQTGGSDNGGETTPVTPPAGNGDTTTPDKPDTGDNPVDTGGSTETPDNGNAGATETPDKPDSGDTGNTDGNTTTPSNPETPDTDSNPGTVDTGENDNTNVTTPGGTTKGEETGNGNNTTPVETPSKDSSENKDEQPAQPDKSETPKTEPAKPEDKPSENTGKVDKPDSKPSDSKAKDEVKPSADAKKEEIKDTGKTPAKPNTNKVDSKAEVNPAEGEKVKVDVQYNTNTPTKTETPAAKTNPAGTTKTEAKSVANTDAGISGIFGFLVGIPLISSLFSIKRKEEK